MICMCHVHNRRQELYLLSRYELKSSLIFGQVHTDGQTESDAYEPTVQNAQVGSTKMSVVNFLVGDNFISSEDLSPIEYTESGLRTDT